MVGLAAAALLLGGAAAVGWLLRATTVGAGYAAKVTCSLAHLSGQDPQQIVERYVASEVWPLGPFLRVDVSGSGALARVSGGILHARAEFRPGLGCILVPGDAREPLPVPELLVLERRRLDPDLAWPEGDAPPVERDPAVEAAIDRAFAEPGGEGRRQTTAVVVARDGRLVAERYAPGYDAATPMLSWSMAKSVTMALVGTLLRAGRLDLQAPAPVPQWSAGGDPRASITLDHLLRQSSGLAFDEGTSPTADLPRMLFAHADTGAYAANEPLAFAPDTHWSYSSGTSNIVARIVRDEFGGDVAAMARFANEALFDPASITSAVFEPDASGTFVGSSFAFMTARDWARFGELFRRDGVAGGRRILPEGYVAFATTPTPAAPQGSYGAHWWLNAGTPGDPDDRPWPLLPPEVFAARGHSGQWVVVVPSARLVVVRLGLTVPDLESIDGAESLVADLLRVFEGRSFEAATAPSDVEGSPGADSRRAPEPGASQRRGGL